MLDIRCPSCERQLQLPEDSATRECQCPACRTIFVPATRIARTEPVAQAAVVELPEPSYPHVQQPPARSGHPWRNGLRFLIGGFVIGYVATVITALFMDDPFVLIAREWECFFGNAIVVAVIAFMLAYTGSCEISGIRILSSGIGVVPVIAFLFVLLLAISTSSRYALAVVSVVSLVLAMPGLILAWGWAVITTVRSR